jgi:pimeloyl-ACP methyl ester carboxylesterase
METDAAQASITRRTIVKQGAILAAGAVMSSASSACSATAPSSAPSTPLTFVVAHGAWSSGLAWKKMHPLMAARGHRLLTPSYTGLGERAHLARPDIDLDTHITDVVNVLVYEDLRDVVLVGHSYGGVVATGVADRARDRITRLIYLDAFLPEDGKSFFDLTGQGDAARAAAVDGWRVPPNPSPPDTPAKDLPWIAARRMHHPIGTLEQPLTLTQGPLTLPRDYNLCTKSDAFRPYAEQATAAGWPVHEIEASHNPHITIPEQLADLVERIARGEAAGRTHEGVPVA